MSVNIRLTGNIDLKGAGQLMKLEILAEKKSKLPDEVQKILADKSIPTRKASELTGMPPSTVYHYRRRLAGGSINVSESRKEYFKNYHKKRNIPRPPRRWTAEEDKVIMTSELTDIEIGNMLDRSICSITHRRRLLRSKPCEEEINRLNDDLSLQNEFSVPAQTKQYRDFIKANYTAMTIKELADALDLSERGISYHIAGIKDELVSAGKNKPRKHKADSYLDYLKEHCGTMLYKDMAEELNLTVGKIRYYVCRLRAEGKLPYDKEAKQRYD